MAKTKTELFLELASPNAQGFSRWVNVSEFVGSYKELKLGNGGSWCRKESTLAKKYFLEFNKSLTPVQLLIKQLDLILKNIIKIKIV